MPSNYHRWGTPLSIPWYHGVTTQIARQLEADTPVPISDADRDRQRALFLEFEQFPYWLVSAHHALETLETEAVRALSLPSPPNIDPNTVTYQQLDQHTTYRLSWAVDDFLSNVRRGQDSVIPYLSKTFRRSLPMSFADLHGNLVRHRLPAPMGALLVDYWAASGERLKQYRDLSQHHMIVSSDARRVTRPNENPTLFLVLPSNSAERSLRRLRYDDPYVPALPYCRLAFLNFYAFSYTLFYLLTRYLGEPATRTMTFVFKDPLTLGSWRGLSTAPTTSIEGELWALRERVRPELESAYGSVADALLTN